MTEYSDFDDETEGSEERGVIAGFISKRRQDLVQKAVATWTGQLIDLGGRNSLLYYRDLKQGTLDLGQASERVLADLLGNKAVRVSKLFPDTEERSTQVRRVRAIRNKSQENFEERGLQTLYLACGMATWDNNRGTANPQAPVLLRAASISADGAAQEDFTIALTGEMEINPTLLHLLETEFQVKCDREELEAQIDGVIDEAWEIEKTFEWLAERASRVPGFAVENRFVVGNFAYAKLPMVNDLENSIEELMAHDLIAATPATRMLAKKSVRYLALRRSSGRIMFPWPTNSSCSTRTRARTTSSTRLSPAQA